MTIGTTEISEHILELEDGTEVDIDVTWNVLFIQERHEVGDGFEWNRYREYTPILVKRLDNESVYELDTEKASEDWHYDFDQAYIDGEIQI